jgi:hypothetical protein
MPLRTRGKISHCLALLHTEYRIAALVCQPDRCRSVCGYRLPDRRYHSCVSADVRFHPTRTSSLVTPVEEFFTETADIDAYPWPNNTRRNAEIDVTAGVVPRSWGEICQQQWCSLCPVPAGIAQIPRRRPLGVKASDIVLLSSKLAIILACVTGRPVEQHLCSM